MRLHATSAQLACFQLESNIKAIAAVATRVMLEVLECGVLTRLESREWAAGSLEDDMMGRNDE